MDEERKDPTLLTRWPAVGLIFAALTSLLWLTFSALYDEEIARWIEEVVREKWGEEAVWEIDQTVGWIELALRGLIGLVVLSGGIAMLNGKAWPLALIAAILTMIPCCGPCCGLFLPIGIWALIVLMKPEVKQAMG